MKMLNLVTLSLSLLIKVSEREEENSLNIELKCKTMSIENDLRNFNLRNSSEKVEKLYISIEGGGSFWPCSIDTSIPKMFRVLGKRSILIQSE